jgi:eukaryotic-like serine/threonine-protein kinase
MGVVWAAEDLATGELRAAKLMKEAAGDPDARRRFLREARAAAAVRHPSVVQIVEVLELDDGAPVIVMELLEGESLRELLARERVLALTELAAIATPVVSAVGAAHELGIVHRDLKPENIFLARGATGERVVKVLDFGIAKLTALDGDAMRSTGLTTGAVLGTPAYMSPEQVFGERDIDHRADIWALGLIVYQCLSGVLPTEAENVGQVLKNVLARPFEPLGGLVPGVPPGLAELVGRMLARSRGERPADLREVLEQLRELGGAGGVDCPSFGPPPRGTGEIAVRLADVVADTHVTPPREAGTGKLVGRGRAAPPRRSARLRARIAAVAAVATVAAGLATWVALRWLGESERVVVPVPVPVVRESPLAPASAKLACPVLRASGIPEPMGWLGAAAAAVACERARVILGGRVERTLAPAELLGLPPEPADSFPADPYGEPDARDRSLTAARQRAQAYLDGEVSWSSAGFEVALSLHRPGGDVIERGSGQGRGLYEAVRAAMAPLVGGELIVQASALEPDVAAWARTSDIGAALAVTDLAFAIAHNAGGLPDECQRFESLSAAAGELGAEGSWLCKYTLGQPRSPVKLDDADDSEAGIVTRIRIDHTLNSKREPDALERLRALKSPRTPRGRALLAVTESCLLGPDEAQEARELAIVAVRHEPKNPEGGWCSPWEQLVALQRGTVGAGGVVRAMQAWLPWNSYAWLEPGFRAGEREPATLPMLRRAHLLSPLDGQITGTLAAALLVAGDRGGVRNIAAALRASGLQVHRVESELLLVRIETSEAQFGSALDKALEHSVLKADDTGWARARRFEIGLQALEIAVLLGRARKVADRLVGQFLDPEPTVLDGNLTSVQIGVPAICTHASRPAACFARFHGLLDRLSGAATRDTKGFLRGAERYVARDFDGAAKAWRPLLAGGVELALADAMVDAFEQTGELELAEQVEREVVKHAAELNGATLGHVHAARRALAGGDRKQARQLAELVVNAWARADEVPPAVAEMRRLLAGPGAR